MNRDEKIAIGVVAVAIIVLILLFFLFGLPCKGGNDEPTVVGTSQTASEQPQEIIDISSQAGINIGSEQAYEAAEDIAYIYANSVDPDYSITTFGADVEKVSKQAAKASGADFAIVTNKNKPDETVNVAAIPDDTKVELNQYNIHAYKAQLNTIEVSPVEKTVEYIHSWKISDKGHYIGVGVEQDIDDNKTILKVSYTW